MTSNYLGIDISKRTFDCCLMLETHQISIKFSNDVKGFKQLKTWLKQQHADNAMVCMEATGSYWLRLANFLYAHGFSVCVENPAKIKYFSKSVMVRNKTDKQDAVVIANYCKVMTPRLWHPDSQDVVELRTTLQMLNRLKKQKASESTKLIETPVNLRQIVRANIAHFDKQIKKIEEYLMQFFKNHPELDAQKQRVKTIPGVGDNTAVILLSILLGNQKFTKSGHFIAYLGLSPQHKQSGTSVNGRSRISKVGKSEFRSALYMPAMVAFSKNLFPQFIKRMREKRKPAKVIIIALMRKIAVYAFTIFNKQTDFKRA